MSGRRYVHRDREEGHQRLYNHYFSANPTYGPTFFRCRFRMVRPLFLRILQAIEQHDDYFVQKRDRAGRLGLSTLQKVTAAYAMISHGVSADFVDDYVSIGESTIIESLRKFVRAVIEIFEDEYLRSPNENDTARLLTIGERRGFSRMLGSIDCMHWKWKNCPTIWHGQYTGHVHEPTIILEAVASKDLWIWHAFFGLPGSHNDINCSSPFASFCKTG